MGTIFYVLFMFADEILLTVKLVEELKPTYSKVFSEDSSPNALLMITLGKDKSRKLRNLQRQIGP